MLCLGCNQKIFCRILILVSSHCCLVIIPGIFQNSVHSFPGSLYTLKDWFNIFTPFPVRPSPRYELLYLPFKHSQSSYCLQNNLFGTKLSNKQCLSLCLEQGQAFTTTHNFGLPDPTVLQRSCPIYK